MAQKRRSTAALNAKRDEIFRTAAQVFRDRGFDGTSVGDVARALKMTKAGLYHYFTGKDALLFEIISFGLDQVRDEVTEPARMIRDPEVRLRELVVRHARIVTRAHGAVASLVDETRALPSPARQRVEERMRGYFGLMRDTIIELQGLGRLRDVDATVGAFGVLGMILWLPRWYRHGGRLTEDEVAEEIAKLALGGLLKSPDPVRPRPARAARGRRGMRKLLPAVLLAWGVAQPSAAQSLADVAKAEAARRAAVARPAKVYTNTDLRDPANDPGEPAAPAPPAANPEPAPAARPAARPATARPPAVRPPSGAPRDDAYWMNRMRALEAKLASDVAAGDAARQRHQKLLDAPLDNLSNAQLKTLAADIQKATAELNRWTAAVEQDTTAIKALETEAQRANVPPERLRAVPRNAVE